MVLKWSLWVPSEGGPKWSDVVLSSCKCFSVKMVLSSPRWFLVVLSEDGPCGGSPK